MHRLHPLARPMVQRSVAVADKSVNSSRGYFSQCVGNLQIIMYYMNTVDGLETLLRT